MADLGREVWITGLGIVSCLGEGPQSHWQALNERRLVVDRQFCPPYAIHRLVTLDFDKQIPKKGDQRQMEAWQRTGTYAAGLALDGAGLKGKADLLARMDLIVAAAGGERDLAVDSAVLSGLPKAANPAAFLNERLTSDLRPTLFLAQLSNLLAGNISIVHGVTGSSRTFMGEESAGVDALRIGLARITAGQSDIALVGGANNAERKDQVMLYQFGGLNWRGDPVSVWERGPEGGFALGSMAAFLVLEARKHAEGRGAAALARLSSVLSEHSSRDPGLIAGALQRMWSGLAGRLEPNSHAIISGATGTEPATGEELAFLGEHADVPVRATGTYLGHGMEPQFPMNVALATVALDHGTLFPPDDATDVEKPFEGALRQVVVTGVGHWRGEGMALVEAVN
jgi:3-oxoacyl-[acyl-carrier-protein] synthase II